MDEKATMNTIELFLRDYCKPIITDECRPGELCYLVTEFSWHLLGGLSQTIALLNDGRFHVKTFWYLAISSDASVLLPKETTLKTLHLSLIDHAEKQSIRWIEEAKIIESYQSELDKYIDLAKGYVGSKEDSLTVTISIEAVKLALDKIKKFNKGEKIPVSLKGVSQRIDSCLETLEKYLEPDDDN